MVPTVTVAGDQTSLDSQLTHDHIVFLKLELVPEEIRGFLSKAPKTDPIVLGHLVRKRSPPLARVPPHTLEFHPKTGARQAHSEL